MKPEEIEREFSGGECIVDRGSEGRELYVVRSGNVMVQYEDPAVEYLLGPGDVFGEATALLSRPQPYRVVAEGNASVLAMPPDLVERLCRECAEFNLRLIRCLAERAACPGDAQKPEKVSPAQRAVASAILARAVAGEGPASVKGRLRDLAEAADLEIREAYLCLQTLLERRLIGLVDDQLTVLEAAELEAIAQA